MKYLLPLILLLLVSCQTATESAIADWAQDSLQDPSSYDPVETRAANTHGWAYQKYRCTNGFGATITTEMHFLMEEGKVVQAADNATYELIKANFRLQQMIDGMEE